MAVVVVVSGDVIETYLRSIWKGELMGLGSGLDIMDERRSGSAQISAESSEAQSW